MYVRIALRFLPVLCVLNAASAQEYHVTNLGVLPGGSMSHALAMNDHGLIVGQSDQDTPSPYLRSVVWADGVIQRITGLGISGSEAADVNNEGVVVGTTDDLVMTETSARPYRWQNGVLTLLPTSELISFAYGVSDAGHIAGADGDAATVRFNGGLVSYGFPGATQSWARAVNSAGHVAGTSSPADAMPRPMVWDGNTVLDIFPGVQNYGEAYDINENDVVVGYVNNHAFQWADGEAVLLPDLGGPATAAAVNNDGWIVGQAYIIGTWTTRAVLWRDGECIDLNTLIPVDSGWHLATANDINERGQIVGSGNIDGQLRAFVLDPAFGDLNANGAVETADIPLFVNVLLGNDADPGHRYRADLNRDGRIDGADLQPFITAAMN